jgi:LPXTG-site transpeptidase (sortase) family protein
MPKKKKSSLLTKKARKTAKENSKDSPKSHLLRNKLFALFLISLAFIILLPLKLPTNNKTQTKNPIIISSKLLSLVKTENTPVRILIPNANIDLPIVSAKVINGYWELSETTASYGLGSGLPGENGNTVIFAHARDGLFYNLKDVKMGDIVYVFSKNMWFRYKVNKITAVYPNEVDVINPTKTQVLTLYTCTGFDDQKRLIVQAIPQG